MPIHAEGKVPGDKQEDSHHSLRRDLGDDVGENKDLPRICAGGSLTYLVESAVFKEAGHDELDDVGEEHGK